MTRGEEHARGETGLSVRPDYPLSVECKTGLSDRWSARTSGWGTGARGANSVPHALSPLTKNYVRATLDDETTMSICPSRCKSGSRGTQVRRIIYPGEKHLPLALQLTGLHLPGLQRTTELAPRSRCISIGKSARELKIHQKRAVTFSGSVVL